jgi:hypothetical protein
MSQKDKQRLMSLYRGLNRAHGIYELLQRPAGGKKVPGRARTVHGAITVELWDKHLAGQQGLGVVPIMDDATCWFGAIDIDKYDLSLTQLETKVADLGLPLLPTRTKSGGCHLYLFGIEPLPAELLKLRLEQWAIALGFGGAEVFPKQAKLHSEKDIGNWINMPYFAILSELAATERYGIFKGQELTLRGFVDRAESIRITAQQLDQLLITETEDFVEGPPCLQALARGGFPEGMRNNAMFAVGVYLKKRYPDDWATYLSQYNVRFFKPPLEDKEVKELVKSLKRKDYNYPCDKPPIQKMCNRSLCRTREFGIGKGSDDWGLVVDSDAQKIDTDPPYWMVTVNGKRLMLFADHIQSQTLFGKLCIEKLGFVPAKLPGDKWRSEMNKLMGSAEVVPAPEDAGVGGELEYHLQQFCTVYPQAETREEILTGKPYIEDGLVYFRSADFKAYLDAKKFRALNGVHLYARLKQAGVEGKQLWIKDANVRVWTVKAYILPPPVPPKSIQPDTEM